MNFALPLSLLVAGMAFLCACQPTTIPEPVKNEISEIKSKVDVIFLQTTNIQSELPSLVAPSYFLFDLEHDKVVGILKKAPPLQVGNLVVWDDDVYQVELVRLHARKDSEKKLSDTTTERTADFVEVFVKFATKLDHSKKPR